MPTQPDDHGPVVVRNRPWWLWPALMGICLVITLGLVIDRLASTGERTLANEEVTQAIQKERARAIRTNCVETNARHANTIKALETLVERQPADRQAEARKGSAQFVLIIDALVPVRDCGALVRSTVVEGK